MGNKQSLPAASNTPKQAGLFQLDNAQTNTIKVISDIFEQLLQDNNLFSLEQILGNQEQCAALILVLSKSLEKEFGTLYFPDPLKSNTSIPVSYILQSKYKELEKEPTRKSLCGSLIFFMVRLVTLVAAFAASLQMNRDIVTILDFVKYRPNGTYNRQIKDLVLNEAQIKELRGRLPIPDSVIESLKRYGLKQVMTEDGLKPDPRNLYFYGYNENMQNTLILDPSKSIAYFAKGDVTGVYSIQLRQIDKSSINRITGYRSMNAQRYDPRAIQAGGKHTRRRQIVRGTRKKGGGDRIAFSLNIAKLFCKSDNCVIPEIFMEADGNTYTGNDYMDLLRSSKLTVPVQTLQERLQAIESQSTDLVDLRERTDEAVAESFGPITKIDKSTLNMLQNIRKTLRSKKEGTSPCFYRGYLLASRLDTTTLQTMFCEDEWAGKPVTSQVSWSLLHSLYLDRADGSMDNETSEEYIAMLTNLLPYVDIANSSAIAQNLENMKFKLLPQEIMATICQSQAKGGRSIRDERIIRILLTAHRELHNLFERHIKQSVEILTRVMTVETPTNYIGKPTILLNPVFTTDPLGSLHAIESIIKESRKIIAAHYLNVEIIYQAAWKEIIGVSSSVESGVNILGKAANTLPKENPL